MFYFQGGYFESRFVGGNSSYLNHLWEYIPEENGEGEWKRNGKMTTARYRHEMTLIESRYLKGIVNCEN